MIYHNIEESIYNFNYNKLTFYFSSKLYLEKFKKEYSHFLMDETMKLKLKYKCSLYIDEIILILLYKKIEKRGFRILYDKHRLKENYYVKIEIDENLSLES